MYSKHSGTLFPFSIFMNNRSEFGKNKKKNSEKSACGKAVKADGDKIRCYVNKKSA